MKDKTIIVISGMVDATIREYQPDVEFLLFRTLDSLGTYVDTTPIRAVSLFFTKDVLNGVNSGIGYLRTLVQNNDFLSVDKVVYITEEGSEEIVSINYLIDEYRLDNWDVVTAPLTRASITEIINGTFRDDNYNVHRKAVYRRPRADYVKSQLRNQQTIDSMQEDYPDDDNYFADIPDEPIPDTPLPERESKLSKVFIAGLSGFERTAFALLAAQYLSLTDKTLIVESDNDYHTLSEFVTKAELQALIVDMIELYTELPDAIQKIRESEENLVIIICKDRIKFDYRFICNLLYYNLEEDFRYIVNELDLVDIPYNTHVTVTVPSTVLGTLKTGENIDRSLVPFCNFVGVNLKQLPEVHINSGVVMATLLSDILSTVDITCPVITASSLRLNGSAYDLSSVLGKGVYI